VPADHRAGDLISPEVVGRPKDPGFRGKGFRGKMGGPVGLARSGMKKVPLPFSREGGRGPGRVLREGIERRLRGREGKDMPLASGKEDQQLKKRHWFWEKNDFDRK